MRVALIFLIATITLGSACKTQSGSSSECKTFLRELNSDWSFDAESKIFRINSQEGRRNQDFLTRIDDHKECLKGLSPKKVRKILGEPSSIDGSRWKYYLVASCVGNEFDNCDFLDLVFVGAGGLESVKLSEQNLVE